MSTGMISAVRPEQEIYFSVDIETNGQAPGLHSMISLGTAAINIETNEIVGKYKVNLLPEPGLTLDPDTMDWWKGFPEAYKRATEGAVPASVEVFEEYEKWVKWFDQRRPVAFAWKPFFDLGFLRYYLWKYLERPVFGRAGSGLDLKTMMAVALGQRYGNTQVSKVPDSMKAPVTLAHDHDALNDSIEQAHMFYWARKKLGGTI